MRLATMVILAAVAAPAPAAQTPRAPSALVDSAGVVSVSFDGSLLRQPEVRKQVLSGLTTNFIVSIDRQKEHGRIDIRFEPWDEVFYVRSIGHAGKIERHTFRSEAELQTWLRAPRLTIGRAGPAGTTARIVLEVIPFSASEEADAKEWLARSVTAPGPARANQDDAIPSLFSAVVSSSIRRKPIVRYAWNTRLEPKRE